MKTDPKVRVFARTLGITRPTAIGMLHMLWWWALDHAENGDLAGIDPRDIAAEVDWPEDRADELWKALRLPGTGGEPGFIDQEGRINNWMSYAGRLVNERERKRRFRKKNSEISAQGRKPAAKAGDGTVPSLGTGLSALDSTVPNPTKQIKESSPAKPAARVEPAGFKIFWKAYPSKVGKAAALAVWRRLRPDQDLLKKMLKTIEAQRASDQWQREGGRFIPHPKTWLNQGRWDDETIGRPIAGGAAPIPGKYGDE